MGPLLDALSNLGARAQSSKDGYLPVAVGGPWRGGRTKVDGTTSQFTSSLLLNAPFGEETTTIEPVDLNERPYVEMTLWWLDRLGLGIRARRVPPFHRSGRAEALWIRGHRAPPTGVPPPFWWRPARCRAAT